jgi:hypothetical protein
MLIGNHVGEKETKDVHVERFACHRHGPGGGLMRAVPFR